MQGNQWSSDNTDDGMYRLRSGSCGGGDPAIEGASERHYAERKNVTILFSNLSEYTRITENLDPEDVQAIMGEIFKRSCRIIREFGGSIERLLGEEIMAVFGNPVTHEDDAVRAINAAREIHRAVDALNAANIIAHPLQMHTGINTGMVITSEAPYCPLSMGITGDAANLAKRIQDFARPGEILVGVETFRQTAGYFIFQSMAARPVKGKSDALSIYRCIGPQRDPRKVKRIFGRRAKLVAREAEIDAFNRAVGDLNRGKGRIICISGEMGTGKSRLVEEFRARLDQDRFLWCEGYAYEFTKNSSYFPFIDLMRREFGILEEDPPVTIRGKVSRETARWSDNADLPDLIGGLFALENRDKVPDAMIDPENWKMRLYRATALLFNAMAAHQPMVICFEDLHWSDPSTIELLSFLSTECTGPILFLLVFRPFFAGHHPDFLTAIKDGTTWLDIKDLAPRDCGIMICSLLGTATIPECLQAFVDKEIAGNPFFLEEVINALVESETISPRGTTWRLNRPIAQLEVAPNIRRLITSRIDRLDPESKNILREAAVIGSSFPADLLQQVSRSGERFNTCLQDLVRLDLIRVKRRASSLEYHFRHALIREVVYDSLLKSERRTLHARIAVWIEKLYGENLPEHFETLAHHFKQGGAVDKAIFYLMQSGRKSLRRYAVEESHRYYQEAFDLVPSLKGSGAMRDERLIETLTNWFPVYYYRGCFGAAEKLLDAHMPKAQSIQNGELCGMFYIGYGMCLWARERFQAAYDCIHRALDIGKSVGSRRVEGYAHAWLTWVCFELGFPEESLAHGRLAKALAQHFDASHYPYYRSLDSDGFAYWVTGDCQRIMARSKALFEYSQTNASSRVVSWAGFIKGLSQMTSGDFKAAIETIRQALKTSSDPLYTMFPKLFLGIAAIVDGDFFSTRELLKEVVDHGRRHGCEVISSPADLFLSVSRCLDGNMKKNVRNINRIIRRWEKNNARWRLVYAELTLGEFYLNLKLRDVPLPPGVILRNLPFLLTALPLAGRRAALHFRRAIQIAETMGAKGMQGQSYLGLARLFHRQRHHRQAIDAIDRALALFKMCAAETFIRSTSRFKTSIEQP